MSSKLEEGRERERVEGGESEREREESGSAGERREGKMERKRGEREGGERGVRPVFNISKTSNGFASESGTRQSECLHFVFLQFAIFLGLRMRD